MTENNETQWAPLAERVRTLRQAKGWSMDRFSKEAGVTKSQVELVERGVTRSLKKGTLERYAKALGVTEDYLRDGFARLPEPGEPLPPIGPYLRMSGTLEDERHIRFIEQEVQKLVELERREREISEA